MRKKILFVFLMLIIPTITYANTINIDCPSTISVNKEFTCEVYGNTETGVTDVVFNIVLPNDVTMISFVKGSNWNGYENDLNVSFYGENVVNDRFDIGTGTFKYNGSSDAVIKLEDVTFYNNFNTYVVDSVAKKIVLEKTGNSATIVTDDSVKEHKTETNIKDDENNVIEEKNQDVASDVIIEEKKEIKNEKANYSVMLVIGVVVLIVLGIILFNNKGKQ